MYQIGDPTLDEEGHYIASRGRPPRVGADLYIKTPGESDGCGSPVLSNGMACARFDEDCAGDASIGSRAAEPTAPEAGHFFPELLLSLAANATLGRLPSTDLSDRPGSASITRGQWTTTMAFLVGLAAGAALLASIRRLRGGERSGRPDGSVPNAPAGVDVDATMPFARATSIDVDAPFGRSASMARLLAPPAPAVDQGKVR